MMTTKEKDTELIRASELGAFDLWALPSFDEGEAASPEAVEEAPAADEPAVADEPQASEDVPVEEVTPLTLEELEAIRQEAYNEGFATGERDGFHSGQMKARQEAEQALGLKLDSLERLMEQLMAPIAGQDQQIEESLLGLLELACREVIRRESKLDSSQVRQVLREALKLLPMGADNLRIFVNPQDFETIKALRDRHEENWRILEDETLQAGGCRVESAHSRIDASIETRLAQVLEQLAEQRHEQAAHPREADIAIDLETPDAG